MGGRERENEVAKWKIGVRTHYKGRKIREKVEIERESNKVEMVRENDFSSLQR